MIQFAISIDDGVQTRGGLLKLDELDAIALARVDELIHEMRDHLERLARVQAADAARRAKAGGA